MKILHLFSNWKWTGPAEPALNLCRTLSRRHEVRFVSGGFPRPLEENVVALEALKRGITPVEGYRLEKHFHPLRNLEDILNLRRFLRRERFDIVHCHMPNDHFIAGCALRTLREKPPVVRTFYDGDGLARSMRVRWLLRHSTRGAVVISRHARSCLLDGRFLAPERVAVIPGGVDTSRFDPARADRDAARAAFGFGGSDFVFGIVARIQRHRKFEVLLEAFRTAAANDPSLRLVLVGRGTHQEEVAGTPVREMGLGDKVLFAGYRQGQDFLNALRAFDCALFLVPGSDGSCRAVREKMSLGLPVIVADTRPLDEIIDDGRTGLVVPLTAANLAGAMARVAGDRAATAAMGKEAREKALADYSLDVQALRTEEFYRSLLRK